MWFEDEKWKLVAPDIDGLINCFDRGIVNPSGPKQPLVNALIPIIEELHDLKPTEENKSVKSLWVKIPRGSLEDFGDFEDYKDDSIKTMEDFEKYWKWEYPEEYKWYKIIVVEDYDKNGDLWFYGLRIGNNMVISMRMQDDPEEKDWRKDDAAIILCELILPAIKKSMNLLRRGKYNEWIDKELPYYHRTGVIKRNDLWDAMPEHKNNIFEGLSDEAFGKFTKLIRSGENDKSKIGRIKDFTGSDFLKACSTGYKACNYDVINHRTDKEMELIDQYYHFADGRDEGLFGRGHGLNEGPGIDIENPDEWERWFFDKNRFGGHPWEVCRGGNSTHVSLYVRHDSDDEWSMRRNGTTDEDIEKSKANWGYYFNAAGDAWNRAAETINFYVAIKEAGYPIVISNGDALLKRLLGEDLLGIVPWDTHPVYCEDMFPEKYGIILDFIHVWEDDYERLKDYIEWLPLQEAQLQEKD